MLRDFRLYGVAAAAALAVAVFAINTQNVTKEQKTDVRATKGNMPGGVTLFASDKTVPLKDGLKFATFAAGCFWGVEDYFRQVEGVTATAVGYTGGHLKKPTYRQVCYTPTGHAEAVRVEYDPKKVTYEKLLEVFWKIHNPCQVGGQGPDRGDQYRSVVFFHSPEQQAAALKSREALQKTLPQPITTSVVPEAVFWMAEEYHQQYCFKNGIAACPIPTKPGGGGH
ncbi:MAG: peptide-methionine (S)-S-oxide reductase MsrA [Fimbriimonadaceae bacterium]